MLRTDSSDDLTARTASRSLTPQVTPQNSQGLFSPDISPSGSDSEGDEDDLDSDTEAKVWAAQSAWSTQPSALMRCCGIAHLQHAVADSPAACHVQDDMEPPKNADAESRCAICMDQPLQVGISTCDHKVSLLVRLLNTLHARCAEGKRHARHSGSREGSSHAV